MRTLGLAVLVSFVLVVAGCGGSRSQVAKDRSHLAKDSMRPGGILVSDGELHPTLSTNGGTRHCPKPVDRAIRAGDLLPALRRLVPRYYADMTNQQGRGAWRGWTVLSESWLGWPQYAGQIFPQSYRRAAVRACGARVADQSWVVIISFPRAQAADLGTDAAYVVRTARGLTIWRDQLVKPQGWK